MNPKLERKLADYRKRKGIAPVAVQRIVSQTASAELEYELLCRAVERGHEQIARATETLAVLQDKQILRLLEQQTQKRRLANGSGSPTPGANQ